MSTIQNLGKYQNIATSLIAIVGVLHDWGKYNDWFQYKLLSKNLKIDPYRHEFISCKMIERSYELYGDDWLEKLTNGAEVSFDVNDAKFNRNRNKLSPKLPTYVKLICYLILSHHKLNDKEVDERQEFNTFDEVFKRTNATEGFSNKYKNSNANEKFNDKEINKCFSFSRNNSLGKDSQSIILAHKNNVKKFNFDKLIDSSDFHIFYDCVRTILMLSDYNVSSEKQPSKPVKKSKTVWANKTCSEKYFGQTVEEHCSGVALKAIDNSNKLIPLVNKLPYLKSNTQLEVKSPQKFHWQNEVVDEIKKYSNCNYFCVNMASTGQGKTIANAKIINAMSKNLRYSLCVGTRNLVTQTGKEYIKEDGNIQFAKNEVSICIGSEAVRLLSNLEDETDEKRIKLRQNLAEEEVLEQINEQEDLMHEQDGHEIEFDSYLDNQSKILDVITTSNKYKAFIYKPVLVCTIDYLMKITQVKKGGKHLLPFLRLISSDLIIDEIDDFNINDLKAIQRLVYLAGLYGKNFVMSSATITPDLAIGFYKAYTKGLEAHNKFFGIKSDCVSILCDEYGASSSVNSFEPIYKKFTKKRSNLLNRALRKHYGEILFMEKNKEHFFNTITDAVFEFHHNNCFDIDGKNVSVGCVRMANVSPCVHVTKKLLDLHKEGYTIKVLCYHSRQILLLRHEQEEYLQVALNRKKSNITDKLMLDIIKNGEKNVIFILVATPIEEVGRDHDFDWAIIEPSSVHSMIQMCGRVLRHRKPDTAVTKYNIGILQYNYAYINNTYSKEQKYFKNPGVENNSDIKMGSYDVNQLGISNMLSNITSEPMINFYNNQKQAIFKNLIEAEHYQASKVNDFETKGAGYINGFINEYSWLMSTCVPFRKSEYTTENNYVEINGNSVTFMENIRGTYRESSSKIKSPKIDKTNLWFERNYIKSANQLAQEKNMDIHEVARLFGVINVLARTATRTEFQYDDNLGFYYEKN